MSQQDDDLLIAAGLDLDDWERGIRDMIADERRVERVLDGVVDSANDAEKALNDIDASINIDADTSELEKVKNIAADISSAGGNIDFSVDESELDTVRRLIEEIDTSAPTVNIEVDDSEVNAAQDEINDIDNEAPSVDVDVDKEEVDEAVDLLEQIRNMQAIEIVMNIGGTAVSFITDTLPNLPGIGSIVALDDAMASFEARTGRTAVALEDLVDDLHGEGITAGVDQIGAVAEQAVQLGIHFQDVDDAALATFNTITVTGGDAVETLNLINQMVELGLAENFQEASDLIVAGFQTGANRGGDLLEVLNEYGSTFSEMGLSGTDALNIINSGLAAGFGNADRVADAVREMGIRVRELDPAQIEASLAAFENGDITVEELNTALGETGAALNELDLLDETEAFLSGELSGEDYFNAVVQGLINVEDEAERARLAVQIFGTQAEDIGVDAITSLTTEGLDSVEGRAQEAADAMTNTISGSIADIQVLVDDLARAFFSSDQLDIDGKLDDIKAAIQTFIDEINSGATFGEALEIALGAPGLEDSIHDLEAVIGNIALAIMQGMAGVLDLIGQGAAATSLRSQIEDMAGGQLVFDLMVADDAQGVTDAINAAVARGLDPAEIQASIETAFNEALAAGDIEGAQAIVDNINAANEEIANATAGALMQAGDVPVTLTVDSAAYQQEINIAVASTQAAINEALAAGDIEGARALAESIGSTLQDEFTRLLSEGSFDLAAILTTAGEAQAGLLTGSMENAGLSDEEVNEVYSNAQEVIGAAEDMALAAAASGNETDAALEASSESVSTFSNETGEALATVGGEYTELAGTAEAGLGRVNVAIDGTISQIGELIAAAEGLSSIDVSVGAGGITDDVTGSAPGHALGGVDSGTFITGEAGRELVTTDTAMAILNNQTTESLLSGLAMLFSGGMSGGNVSETNVTQNNYFNNNGAAASNASLDNAARGIRGF